MQFDSDIAFVVIGHGVDWRHDITMATAKFYANKFNGVVYVADTIDAALANNVKSHLFILHPGYVVLTSQFFSDVHMLSESNMFLGELRLEDDYCMIDTGCIYVNSVLWKNAGSPLYCTPGKLHGVDVGPSVDHEFTHTPRKVVIVPGRFNNITINAANHGGHLVMKQLEQFGEANALPSGGYNMPKRSALFMLQSETQFISRELPYAGNSVNLFTDRLVPTIAMPQPDVLIVTADGLYAKCLVDMIRPKKVIVWSSSQQKLALQRIIFGLERTTNLENIGLKYAAENPSVEIIGSAKLGRNQLVQPTLCETQFALISPIGYDMERLLLDLDPRASVVLDIGDAFVDPVNYFRTSLDMIDAFFARLCELLASRISPSRLIGTSLQHAALNGDILNVRPPIDFSGYPTFDSMEETKMLNEVMVNASALSQMTEAPDCVRCFAAKFAAEPFTVGMFLRMADDNDLAQILELGNAAMSNSTSRMIICMFAIMLATGEALPVDKHDDVSILARRLLLIVQVEQMKRIYPDRVSIAYNTLTLESFNAQDYGFKTKMIGPEDI